MPTIEFDITDELIQGWTDNSCPTYPWAAIEGVPTDERFSDENTVEGLKVLCLAHDKIRLVITDAQFEELKYLFVHGERKWPPFHENDVWQFLNSHGYHEVEVEHISDTMGCQHTHSYAADDYGWYVAHGHEIMLTGLSKIDKSEFNKQWNECFEEK